MEEDSLAQDTNDQPLEPESSRTSSQEAGEGSGSLILSDDKGYVGEKIGIRGLNLPANEQFEIFWQTVEGSWGVLKANDIVGPQYQPRTTHVATMETNDDGRFDAEWTIPQDYGGEHTIELQDSDQRTLDKATISIRPWFEINRTEAPLGETFRIVGYGLGPEYMRNNYQIAWDNGLVGFMTGVMNRGTATAEIRAVPSIGEHVVQVWRNYRGVPMLQNNTQSPFGPVGGKNRSVWTVEVTEPESEPQTMWMDNLMDEDALSEHFPELDEETGAELEITPTSGQPGTTAVLRGRNFPEDSDVDLIWYTHEGHVIQGIPITTEPDPDMLPLVTSDSQGEFEIEIRIPKSLGATRPITAEVNGRSVAVTGFMVQPKILDMSPTEGPVGTDIEFTFTGIGWPNYETNYYFVYDNQVLGYVCGNDRQDGVVRTVLKAAGDPGTHFVDVYPGLFDVEKDKPNFELLPHLSYLDNHPVRPLPAFHFSFEVTE